MLPPRFTDPLGRALPAFERNILKLRAMQMLLVLFYTEELKRDILSLIRGTDRAIAHANSNVPRRVRVPEGTKKPIKKALTALVADKAITTEEMTEIEMLIDYRNVIGHNMHSLMADLNPERIAREMVAYSPDQLARYDYKAVERLQHFHKRLSGLYRTHTYLYPIRCNRSLFLSTEDTLLIEVKRLDRKICRMIAERDAKVQALNLELSLDETVFNDEMHPRDPLNCYDNGRLTKRGVEICYRLFDIGKSAMAVAHLAGLSLVAARKRYRWWQALGGPNRPSVDLALIPRRKFYAKRDD